MSQDAGNVSHKKSEDQDKGSATEYNKIQYVVAIMSGKGGVGKSTVTGLLASELVKKGYHVGILDADITGPSIPLLFGLHGPVDIGEFGIQPLSSQSGIKIISMNLLIEKEDQPIVWRGPLISQAIKQLFGDVMWGELDYLLVDLPPGTSDATLTIMQSLPVNGIIMVTTPQSLAAMVVSKTVHMAQKLDVPILGIVENLSFFLCPDTGKKHLIFGVSHTEEVSKAADAPIMARLPIDSEAVKLCDSGKIEDVVLLEAKNLAEIFLRAAPIKSRSKIRPGLVSMSYIAQPFQTAMKPGKDAMLLPVDMKEDNKQSELSPKAKELIKSKENWGVLESPDGYARIGGICGDTMQIALQLEGDLICDVRYMTDGCGPSIASAGMATRLAKGKTIAEAQKITQDDILCHLGGLPDDHKHCAKLAALTLQRAIQNIGQTPEKLEESS